MLNINRYSANEIELLAMVGLALCHAINDGIISITPGIEMVKVKRAHELFITVYEAQDTIHTGNYERVVQLTKKMEKL